MREGQNVFLTGMAGTGKSYLLNKFIDWCEDNGKILGITASTGIAATHIGGVTIHSWSGIGIHDEKTMTEEVLTGIARSPYVRAAIANADVLIIDEISMLHAYQLDGIDFICTTVRDDKRPFGGLQIILTGDFLQIPPVSKTRNVTYAFDSNIWRKANLAVCYLEEIHRQSDQEFIDILNEVRYGTANPISFATLKKCIGKQLTVEDPTELYPLNKDVDYINLQKLGKINSPEKKYLMTSRGKEPLVNFLKRSCITPEDLRLKIGAHVIFTKNNFEEGYSNGTFGKVVEMRDKEVIVQTTSGKQITADKVSWEIKKFNPATKKYEIEASISQLPLKLAYALTAHKSQGFTLEHAKINLSGLFSFNMGYVALSRVKSLENLTLVHLDESIYLVDPVLLKKDKEFRSCK
jgi:ATP-dependent exoDNAse (exonuclease V) alpha subunit